MTALRPALVVLALGAAAPLSAQPPRDNFGDPLPEGAKARVGTTRMHRPGGGAEWGGAALTPDGKFLLAPVTGGAIERIDVTTGRAAGTVGGKESPRTGRDFIHLSADGTRGVSFGQTAAVVWDMRTGRVLTRVERTVPHDRHAVALSADGKTLALGDHNNPSVEGKKMTAVVWDVGAQKRRLEVEVSQDYLVHVALSPDGKLLATWGTSRVQTADALIVLDSPVQFWDAATGKALGLFTVKETGYVAVTFTPDGKHAALADVKGTVFLIDPKTGRQAKRLSVRGEHAGRLHFSPDGKTLAVGWGDGTVRLWDVAADKEISVTKCPAHVGGSGVQDIAFTGRKRAVAWGIEGSKATVWEVPSGEVLSPRGGHWFGPDSLAFAPDGKELLSRGDEWTLSRWDLVTGRPLGVRTLEAPRNVNLPGRRATRPLRGGARVEAWAGEVRYVYDAGTGKRLHDLGLAGRGNSPHLCTDGELTLTPIGVDPGQLPPPMKPLKMTVTELATGKKLCEIEIASREFYTATRTPDRKRLLTQVHLPRPGESRRDYVLTLWDLATGEKLGEVTEPGDPPWFAPTPGPDNKSVLATNAAGELRAIDLTTGKVVRRIDTGGLTVCAGPVLGPDGKLFAVGLCDPSDFLGGPHEVRVHDAATGKTVKTLRGHTGLVSALAFSPDGKTLASGSHDTTVILWDLSAIGK